LYTTSSACLFSDGSLFEVYGPHPTGTGVIDSFLRVQQNGYEEGFNTSARPMLCDGTACDDKTDPNYTRNLLTTAVSTTTINGTLYREFFLDINEPASTSGGKNYLTLDQVEIYQSDVAGLSDWSSTTGLSGATKIWDMDPAVLTTSSPAGHTSGTTSVNPAGDNWINLDYILVGGGSGYGDMVMYIPDAFFTNQKYVYLYTQFGCYSQKDGGDCGKTKYGSVWTNQYPSQAGFEEWWVKASTDGGSGGTTPMPEPGTLALMGTGLAMVVRRRWNSRSRNSA
jgi:hypothetical protein